MGRLFLDIALGLLGICCQIPLLDDVESSRDETSPGCSEPGWIWATFAAGVALLALSLWSATWLALRLF